jgi:hypothetical protein
MAGKDQGGNELATNGAGGACNKDPHGIVPMLVAAPLAPNPAEHEFKHENLAEAQKPADAGRSKQKGALFARLSMLNCNRPSGS